VSKSKNYPDYKTWRDRAHYLAYVLYNDNEHSVSSLSEMFNMDRGAIHSWIKRGKFLSVYFEKTGEYIGAGYLDEREGFN